MTIRNLITFTFIVIQFTCSGSLWAQNWGRISGVITDADTKETIPGVTIVVKNTQTGTASDDEGKYSFKVPERSWLIRYSYVGYESVERQVEVLRDRDTVVNIQLQATAIQMESVVVEEESVSEDISVEIIGTEQIQNIPTGINDAYRNLKILPGVVSNSEMTNDYSVRGGGYNENQVLVNGFEIYKPQRLRQGEQEGLGLVNPNMVRTMTFYTGGFPARYGGKLSSALDVEYLFPTQKRPIGSVSMSLLDAHASIGASTSDNRLSGNFGFRKAKPSRFFGTQELRGDYDPEYTDFQAAIKWKPKEGQELQVLGMRSQHEFQLRPSVRRTNVGQFRSVTTFFDGLVDDSYNINFVGVRSVNKIKNNITAIHGISLFEIDEKEDFDISAISTTVPFADPSDPDTSNVPIGGWSQSDFAENKVSMRDITARGKYLLSSNRQVGEAGWYIRSLLFSDRINEKTVLERENSEGLPERTIVDSLFDSAKLNASQFGGYVQHNADLNETRGRFILTSGVRADFYTFNKQLVFSPRISARFRQTENLTLSASFGVYHQFANYKELRGIPESGASLTESLNDQIKAQRSTQLVTGLRYFYPKHRFYFKAEAYYKNLDHLISYDVDNIRLNYSGVNDTKGKTYGFDLQIRGEMVPGLESWINYGFLISREEFFDEYLTPFNQGIRRRPGDQRHTFSIFIQDYLPYDPSFKVHLRMLFGSGSPYTQRILGETVGDFTPLIYGSRLDRNYPAYIRSDMGTTKSFVLKMKKDNSRSVSAHFTFEILNVFDVENVAAYQWVADVSGNWSRIPRRLTPRTLNFRTRVDF